MYKLCSKPPTLGKHVQSVFLFFNYEWLQSSLIFISFSELLIRIINYEYEPMPSKLYLFNSFSYSICKYTRM